MEGIMIGEQIRFYRQERHIKQDELAEYLGVSFQAVSKWETGASTPDISLLPKLAVYFGISIDQLFELPYDEQMERIENMVWKERRIEAKTFDNSIHFLEEQLKENPKDARALTNLAYLYNHRAHSDHELAAYYAEKALEINPDDKSPWVAYLEAKNGVCGDEWYDNHYEVIRFCENFLEKHPNHFQALYAIIENLLTDHRYDEAMPYIEQIKKVKKNNQYLLYCGDVAFGKGDIQQAKAYWEQMIVDYPDLWQAYCGLGEGYTKLGDMEAALKMFEHCYVMQQAPRIYDGLCAMAQIHETQKEYEKAIQDYERIITCLNEDYGVKDGEQVDCYLREIKRLKELVK
jgi:transcriptional regulator with XRE-family HTH domain